MLDEAVPAETNRPPELKLHENCQAYPCLPYADAEEHTSNAMDQLNVNANVVNGIYSSVEVLLTILLLRVIRIFLSCHNLSTIYDVRKPLHLRASSLAAFIDPGLGPSRIITPLALFALLFTALTTAGGFSFAGVTEPQYESEPVRNKLVRAGPGAFIDFREHISSNGTLISGTFLLLQGTTCVQQETGELTFFELANDIGDLTDIKWPIDELISNSTCLRNQNGFREEVLYSYRYSTTPLGTDNCELGFSQVGVHNLSQVRRNDTIQIPFSDNHDLGANCPFRIAELWCSTYRTFRCVGSLRMDEDVGGGYGQIVYHPTRDRNLRPAIGSYRARRREHTEVLKSMAFLSDHMLSPNFVLLRVMASSMIETDASIERLVGGRSMTNVNVSLLVWTFGTALTLLIVFAVVTYLIWVLVVWRKGRRDYNCFCSETDALACAVQQLYWAEEDGAGGEKGGAIGVVDGIAVRCVGDEF